MRVYLDTSVYDAAWLLEKRHGKIIYVEFDQFLASAMACRHVVVVNKLIEWEILSKYPNLESLWRRFDIDYGRKIVSNGFSPDIKKKSYDLESEFSALHFPDSLHLAFAIQYSDVLVTLDQTLRKIASEKMAVGNLGELI